MSRWIPAPCPQSMPRAPRGQARTPGLEGTAEAAALRRVPGAGRVSPRGKHRVGVTNAIPVATEGLTLFRSRTSASHRLPCPRGTRPTAARVRFRRRRPAGWDGAASARGADPRPARPGAASGETAAPAPFPGRAVRRPNATRTPQRLDRPLLPITSLKDPRPPRALRPPRGTRRPSAHKGRPRPGCAKPRAPRRLPLRRASHSGSARPLTRPGVPQEPARAPRPLGHLPRPPAFTTAAFPLRRLPTGARPRPTS